MVMPDMPAEAPYVTNTSGFWIACPADCIPGQPRVTENNIRGEKPT